MNKRKEFTKLVNLMKRLRGRDGCPWDKKQTHKTLMPYLLEESYELIEAINKNDKKAMKEELGDLLLQVVFHAQIASEKKNFDIYDVAKELNNKLISRHPHVFGNVKGLKKDWHVRDYWEKNKKKVKKRDSVIEGVPEALPALLRARRLQSKAQSTGFKWKTKDGIIRKINEEVREVKGAVKGRKKKDIEEEIGDLLFVIVSLSYFYKINPENALQKTNKKFIKRFKKIEKKLHGKMSEKQMIALWKKTKNNKGRD